MRELIKKLPLWVESVLFGLGTALLAAGVTHIKSNEALTWEGLGLAILAALANYITSYVRLHQRPPVTVPKPTTPTIPPAELEGS